MSRLQISRVLHKISIQLVAPSGCPFYNPTNAKNNLYLKPCSLSTNEDIRDRKTSFQSADLYEPSDIKRIRLKPTRAAQFKRSAYFLNRLRIYKLKNSTINFQIFQNAHVFVEMLYENKQQTTTPHVTDF